MRIGASGEKAVVAFTPLSSSSVWVSVSWGGRSVTLRRIEVVGAALGKEALIFHLRNGDVLYLEFPGAPFDTLVDVYNEFLGML